MASKYVVEEISLVDSLDPTKRRGIKKLRTSGGLNSNPDEVSANSVLQPAINAKADVAALGGKQDVLVSGTNIKTINGSSILGAGDMAIGAGAATGVNQTTAAAKPAIGAGKINYVSDTEKLELSTATAWKPIATEEFVASQIGTSGNKMNALNIMDFGGVANASAPVAPAINATGTDNSGALQAMFNSHNSTGGQACIIPNGNFRFSATVTPSYTTRRLLYVYGTIYVDEGVTLINCTWTSGQYILHRFNFYGSAFGHLNLPSHTKGTYDAGTQPDWASLGSILVKVKNANQVVVETARCEGFKAPVSLEASDGIGGQENTVIGRFWTKCAYGVYMVNTTGGGWMDKNKWIGPENGTFRFSGGTAIWIESQVTANAAFRSNKIELMIEQVDEIMYANGDITEPEFNLTIEGGTTTGVFSVNPINARTTTTATPLSKYVRNPRYNGRGVLLPMRMGTAGAAAGSMGNNAIIDMAIWTDTSNAYLGNRAYSDGNGVIYIEASYTLSQVNRDNVTSVYPFIKFVPAKEREDWMALQTTSPSSIPYGVKHVPCMSGVSVPLPSPSSNVLREITVYNDDSTTGGTVVVTGTLKAGSLGVIQRNNSVTYKSDGAAWRVISTYVVTVTG